MHSVFLFCVVCVCVWSAGACMRTLPDRISTTYIHKASLSFADASRCRVSCGAGCVGESGRSSCRTTSAPRTQRAWGNGTRSSSTWWRQRQSTYTCTRPRSAGGPHTGSTHGPSRRVFSSGLTSGPSGVMSHKVTTPPQKIMIDQHCSNQQCLHALLKNIERKKCNSNSRCACWNRKPFFYMN